jgi:hypothetical protein
VKRAAAIAVLALAALAAACGTPSADLFVVERSGELPGAKLDLVVGDGGSVTCNGTERDITSAQLLDARNLAEDLAPLLDQGITLPPAEQSLLRFKVLGEQGTVEFSDSSRGLRPEFARVIAFTRAVAKQACRLPR